MARRKPLVAAGTVTALVAGLAAVQLLPGASPVASAAGLQPWESCDALLEHYRDELWRSATPWGVGGSGGVVAIDAMGTGGGLARGGAPQAVAAESADAGTDRSVDQSVGLGATGTNTQERGVDEPDRAKLTDGRLLVLSGGQLQVLSAGRVPRLLGGTRLGPPETSHGGELLVAGDRVLVVQQGWREAPTRGRGAAGDPGAVSSDEALAEPAPGRTGYVAPGVPTTRLLLLDVAGDTPVLLESAEYDGQYVSARLVGDSVRLVTTSRPSLPVVNPTAGTGTAEAEALRRNRQAAAAVTLDAVLPQVRRTAADGTRLASGRAVDCTATSHAVGAAGAATLLVTTLQPSRGLASSDEDAVTTDGDLVYASTDRLYVATSRWGTAAAPAETTTSAGVPRPAADEVSTELHGFDISSPTSTTYLGTGSVPGYVLGRWALSAHEGALRVATTRQPPWQGEQTPATSSMVVVLAEREGRLVETGRVEGLGRTEHIKAVRYFGDLAAVVTFRQTDPLYLVDLAGTPRVLGELKVPGFSTYLHPLGDGLLLGLGHEATDEGRVTGVQASVFDVRDPARPTQVSRLQLGTGGTPALDDSRAFSYDAERRTAYLPWTAYDERQLPDGAYHVDARSGVLAIAVGEDGTLRRAGQLLEPSTGPSAERVLVGEEAAYAVAEGQLVAVDPEDLAVTARVDLAG